ncbi:peroxiredoxin [Alteribacter lacisalsi]|uniref:thioredoxin-dependent peroxiredoxin n=1 Tax=Alteribacter lacisalsi TaxID=2045244 RepID=A0A2W0H9S7_9BACI|nr:redoxin domain-containing protein [Alteribacter lacisalsi]PYZ97536.1 peroxiredoxin [Alteribacter lacisalsi]
MADIRLGDRAPDVKLNEVSADQYNLKDDMKHRPGWRFLVFIRGSWCPVCVEELRQIQENLAYFSEEDIHFTCISTDRADNLRKMKQEYNFPFPVLADEKNQALKDYGVLYHEGESSPYDDHGEHGEAACFLLDEEGRLLYQHKQTGPFGRPGVKDLKKIVNFIRKNKKEFASSGQEVKKPNMPY